MLCCHQDCQRDASGTYTIRSGSFAGRAQRIWRAHCLQYHDSHPVIAPEEEEEAPQAKRPRLCGMCGNPGHTRRACPETAIEPPPQRPRSCGKCGEPGHTRRTCTDDRAPPTHHLSEPFFCPLLSLNLPFSFDLFSFSFSFFLYRLF